MAKEVIHLAANFYLVGPGSVGAGPFTPRVEVALVTSEPVYGFDAGGQMVRSRVPETLRFHTGPEGLRALAESFAKWADEAEAMGAELVERHEDGLAAGAGAEPPAKQEPKPKAGKPAPPAPPAPEGP